ncbi:MAG: FaeA/PapI family transcriptional regulator [Methanosarcina sp.]
MLRQNPRGDEMARFEAQYTEKDFLDAINGGLKTTGYATKKVGCARKTAETYLNRLHDAGKIKKLEIDDGLNHVWKINEQ